MLIKLTDKDMADCRQSANLRSTLARAGGIVNQQRDVRSGVDLDFLGIRSEVAVAKLYDVSYNPNTLGVDDGVDLWLGEISIDVKSTFYPTGQLLFKSLEAFKSRAAVLVTKTDDENVMDVAGCISRKAFVEKAVQTDLGRGKCFVMPQDQLWGVDELWRSYKCEQLCP